MYKYILLSLYDFDKDNSLVEYIWLCTNHTMKKPIPYIYFVIIKYNTKFTKRFPACAFSEHQQFVLCCLKLLTSHLSLAVAAGAPPMVLGAQCSTLRQLLFRLLDRSIPQEIQEVSDLFNMFSLVYSSISVKLEGVRWGRCEAFAPSRQSENWMFDQI